MFGWPVVPMCPAQLQDINPADILNDGLYRKCDTYKGGGGYDKFPAIYKDRFGESGNLNNQFVVQLFGCPLRCPYCYVIENGVFGKPVYVPTDELVAAFRSSGCEVFHLMGGAPAVYIEHWHELLDALDGEVFHSDFVLLEGVYSPAVLKEIAKYSSALYAVSIKGADEKEYKANTGVDIRISQLWGNLDAVIESGINFYFTFTGMSAQSIDKFKNAVLKRYRCSSLLLDAFTIDLVHYHALDYIKRRGFCQ